MFGVTRAYEEIHPWVSARAHMDQVAFETAAAGAFHLIVGRPPPDSPRHPVAAHPHQYMTIDGEVCVSPRRDPPSAHAETLRQSHTLRYSAIDSPSAG